MEIFCQFSSLYDIQQAFISPDIISCTHSFVLFVFQQAPYNATRVDLDSIECVFWDFTKVDRVGDWSGAGCELARQTDDTVSCHCSHATNFAILVVCSFSGKLQHW